MNQQPDNRSENTPPDDVLTFQIEHSSGTCELTVRRILGTPLPVYEPLQIRKLSGHGVAAITAHTIANAIAMDEWMSDNPEVFTHGRTSLLSQARPHQDG